MSQSLRLRCSISRPSRKITICNFFPGLFTWAQPLRLLFSQTPSIVVPSSYVNFPLPSFTSIFHSPSYYVPSISTINPLPCLHPSTQSPSKCVPSFHRHFPNPYRISYLKEPSYIPESFSFGMKSASGSTIRDFMSSLFSIFRSRSFCGCLIGV